MNTLQAQDILESEILRNGCFVTGTDTAVGKTVAAAALALRLKATYWKPVQTGTGPDTAAGVYTDDDTLTVARLAGVPTVPPCWRLPEPLSPHAAAALAGISITVQDLLSARPLVQPLVVEGAGGVLVPLNDRETMLDLMAALALPAVVVARSTLGTINHTLLTLAALRQRQIPVAGVILNGPPNSGNRQAIAHFGQVPVLAEIAPVAVLDSAAVAAMAGQLVIRDT
jgi:dethiobiotin synthase